MPTNVSIIVHRGASEIGGNTIQIISGEDSILLDYGSPLKEALQAKIFDEVSQKKIKALIISHAHLDHTGMSGTLQNIPFYMGHDTEKALRIQSVHTKKGADFETIQIEKFDPKKEFSIGNFQILPIPVNHSSYGSYSFIIKTGGKKIFYSGDLRAHGRSPHKWIELKKIIQKESPFDFALVEGTSLSSDRDRHTRTEEEIQLDIEKKLNEHNVPFLIQFSPLNVDRLVSVFKAACSANKKFIIDSYAAHILHEISKDENMVEKGRAKIPSWKHKTFQIYRSHGNKKIPDENLREKLEQIAIKEDHDLRNSIMLVRTSMGDANLEPVFNRFNLQGARFIYSQYSGYREKWESQKKFEKKLLKRGVILDTKEDGSIDSGKNNIHTSGHIDSKHLEELLQIMKPKILCPIHTENRDAIRDIYDGQIQFLENGEVLEV